MDARIHTLNKVFEGDVQFLVPMFQRPYVWNQEDQWDPLWEDVEAMADRLLERGADEITPHFLGAIVVAQQHTSTGDIDIRHVIDGQQRLTTLQLMIDAVEEVVRSYGAERDSKRLRRLILNDAELHEGDDLFKVWPTNVDQDGFRAAMDDALHVPDNLADQRITQAHDVFQKHALAWADVRGDPDKCTARLGALTTVLIRHLQLAVIDLTPEDNAQAIFETLNARGTPLLASDLVKNHLLHEAENVGLDTESLHRDYWTNFDTEHWRREVQLGRLFWPRLDVFLYHWMVMNLAREVPTQQLFTEFRNLIGHRGLGPDEALAELNRYGQVYDQIDTAPEDESPAGRFFYRWRTMQASVVTPLLLHLHAREAEIGETQLLACLAAIESWLVRRMLCRAGTKGYNHFLYGLIRDLEGTRGEYVAETVTRHLLAASAVATEWPTDQQTRTGVLENPLYRQLTRGRLRLVLEAIENHLRSATGMTEETCPLKLTIEHVMPQQWSIDSWPLPDGPVDEMTSQRETIIHTLGNLTLVNNRLNPSLSNAAWTSKRDGLRDHSVLHLKQSLIECDDWTEASILDRGEHLADIICDIWPRPDGSA